MATPAIVIRPNQSWAAPSPSLEGEAPIAPLSFGAWAGEGILAINPTSKVLDYNALLAQWKAANNVPYNKNCGPDSGVILAMQAGLIVDSNGNPLYVPGTSECAKASGVSVAQLQLQKQANGYVLSGAITGSIVAATASPAISGAISGAAAAIGITAGALTIIPIVGAIAAGIIGLFEAIKIHHAKAVAAEQSELCTAVPAANNYLQIIQDAVDNGTIPPRSAILALDSLLHDFYASIYAAGITQRSTSGCNAACCIYSNLEAVVLALETQYQYDILNAVDPTQPAIPGTVSNYTQASVAAQQRTSPASLAAIQALIAQAPSEVASTIVAGTPIALGSPAIAEASFSSSTLFVILLAGLIGFLLLARA